MKKLHGLARDMHKIAFLKQETILASKGSFHDRGPSVPQILDTKGDLMPAFLVLSVASNLLISTILQILSS